MRSMRTFMCALAVVALPAVGAPCLWDSDTLDDELRGLPDAFDLVVGRWHRHGDAYYRARVAALAGLRPLSLAQFDDLAVAHEMLGERDAAIAVMREKGGQLAGAPDREHEYRYHANLGTFLAHAGRHAEGLAELRRAVAINPDAHFGREHFQIELIEYVIAATAEPRWWASGFLGHAGYRHTSWIVSADPDVAAGERELDWQAAYTAIAGMLRFGGREGAVLYRALAELFLAENHLHLAWWSLQRAVERGHPAADRLRAQAAEIEAHWRDANRHNGGKRTPIPTLAEYRELRAAADRWLARFQQLEADAIARGEVVGHDAALRALLAAADAAVPRPARRRLWFFDGRELQIVAVGVLVAMLALLLWDRRRRARPNAG